MLSPELLKRLEQLNRQQLPPPRAAAPRREQPLDAPAQFTIHAPHALPPCPAPAGAADCSLLALAPGDVVETPAGPHYRITQPLADLWPAAPAELLSGQLPTTIADTQPEQHHPELVCLARSFPRGALLLDLETCGFAGSAIFLIGLLHWHDDRLVLEQLLARDYREERAILVSLWQRVAANRVLVSFNGKSFDWPMVHDRSTYHHLGHDARDAAPAEPSSDIPLDRHTPRPALPHCDLLHHARRRWRRRLPNCKLQTLEKALCRRVRNDDIPGHQIPHEYHQFVRTADARQLARILHHNLLDLVTLLEVGQRLVQEGRRTASG